MDHDTEIPGAGPTRILAIEEGDAVDYPPEVENAFRRLQPRRPTTQTREEILATFRADFEGSVWSPSARLGCWRDWTMLHPELESEIDAIVAEVDHSVRRRIGRTSTTPLPEPAPLRLVHSGEPISKAPSPPIFVAVLVCVCALLLIECVLIALRVGNAITWDWGLVLAPLLLPTVVATIVVVLTAIALAAMDERDAARRRTS